ncbi:hypothetical protein [Sedimentisphaera salicampi]|uniref:Uncharacterized protein n=1 Tax=Sedimentisphaera salicampi TaxID=1941349 RepID=A0A1W6LNC4_9BACT|nr:hypothetical protein [Sedimentisphaera salicampi]ARN57264.1 hypothetical protein STSP1_01667 [Sedimentisphaera salicampi]OXU14667.1 hypothetical protein SMSP1_01588 [Sedimentisphaera salicampi]
MGNIFKKQYFIAAAIGCLFSAANVNAGELVPQLDDSTARFNSATPQVGQTGDIDPIEGEGAITLAARFTPSSQDISNSASGPVIIIETGGTTFGNGIYLCGGDLVYFSKGSNGSGGNFSTQTSLNDTDVSDNAASYTIGPVNEGEDTTVYVSLNSATGELTASLNGEVSQTIINGTVEWANLSGNESVSFFSKGSSAQEAGFMGGLTNTDQGQGDLWDAGLAQGFSGVSGAPARGQIFAQLAPEVLPPYSVFVSETDEETLISEGGITDEISVGINSDPGQYSVEVVLSLSEPGQANLSQQTLTFTNSNWENTQTVTITAADDNIMESKVHSAELNFEVSADEQSEYNGFTAAAVTVDIQENDCGSWGMFNKADFNNDCQVDFEDALEFSTEWLSSTMPGEGA